MEQVYKKTGILFKILPCLLIILFFAMCISAPVFASDEEEVFDLFVNNTTYFDEGEHYLLSSSFYETYPYWIITCPSEAPNTRWLFFSKDPIVANVKDGGGYLLTSTSSIYRSSESMLKNTADLTDLSISNLGYSNSYTLLGDFWVSTYDVLTDDGNVVFQAPVEDKKTILAPVIQKQETTLQGTLGQIVKILPTAMIVLVSYLALRKALAMLLTFLRKS